LGEEEVHKAMQTAFSGVTQMAVSEYCNKVAMDELQKK
jgi:hypothetical protein